MLGFFIAVIGTHRNNTPMLDAELGPVKFSGRVQALEVMRADYDARLILNELQIEGLALEDTPHSIRLRIRKDYNIKVGDRIEALGQLMPLSGVIMPDGFDFRRHLYFENIGAVGFIYSQVSILETGKTGSFSLMIETLRSSISKIIHLHLPEREANIVSALMNGQRAGISEEDQDSLRHAGLAHLLAISGLHLGLVCGSILFFTRAILAALPNVALYYPVKKYAAVLAIIGGLAYMFLAGATIPTQRAMLMSAVVFTAILIDRSPFSLRLVAFAAFIVLIINPYSLLSASFQLSFAAVTALIAFYDRLRPAISSFYREAGWFKKTMFYFVGVCTTSLVASFATAPLSLYHFQQFAVYGLLANMVAIPIMAFWVMPLIVLTMILMPFDIAGIPLQLIGLGIQQILAVSEFTAGLDGAVYRLPAFSFWLFLPFMCALVFFVLWQGRLRFFGIGIAIVFIPLIILQKRPDVLISSGHDLVAFRGEQSEVIVNRLRKNTFARENWEQNWGLEKGSAQLWSKAGACDDQGCRVILRGKNIAYTTTPYSHKEDCQWAAVLIADDPVRIPCKAVVVDKYDTYYNGAHAIYLENSIHIKSVRHSSHAKRPWSVKYPDQNY